MSKKNEEQIVNPEPKNENKVETKAENNDQQEKIASLTKQLAELISTISSKDEKIARLETQIEELNKDFINKVSAKVQEGNERIKLKIAELQANAKEELEQKKKFAIEPYAIELINIINQLDIAVNYKSNDPKINNFLIGFQMFSSMFHQLLEQMHIHEIPVKQNDEFNPNYMQCIEYVIDENTKPNHVSVVVNVGYKLHERVIVTSKVKVAKSNDQKN
ncbi:MAG: nucleotide exchange factor GrpE [Mycoplasmataceae bacterium]|jgi:molecular chaperone GrpE|nr:nucleotide exchange factor GrpE [Mycoplasmataceae bacterium]